tara:strand:+ start:3934 stop:4932 length:999 start_codon:yes stop_codon:yes gene_type:complete
MNLIEGVILLLNNIKYNVAISQKNYNYAFEILCRNGRLNQAKNLLERHQEEIDIEANDNKAFVTSCTYGQIHIAKWLYELRPNMNVSAHDNNAFVLSCKYGYYDIVTWLYDKVRNIDDYIEESFELTCITGKIKILKWLLEKKPDLDICMNDNVCTKNACYYDQINVLKWLYQLKNNEIFLNDQEEELFIKSCERNNIEIVKWLYDNKPSINITINNDIAFKNACNENSINVAEWFNKLNPERYYIEKNADTITHFNIIKKFTLSDNYVNVDEVEDCCICMNSKCDVITHCKHQFCADCLIKTYKRNEDCPKCRSHISIVDNIKISKKRRSN